VIVTIVQVLRPRILRALIVGVGLFLSSNLIYAEVFVEHKEGAIVSGVFRIWENDRGIFRSARKLRAEIPLPGGAWTVRYITEIQSNHQSPVKGMVVWLDSERDKQIIEHLSITVFERNQTNWNDTCERGLDQKMFVGMFSDCYQTTIENFMRNPSNKNQTEVRRRWIASGLTWDQNAIRTKRVFHREGYGITVLFHTINPRELGITPVPRLEDSPLHLSNLHRLSSNSKAVLDEYIAWSKSFHNLLSDRIYSIRQSDVQSSQVPLFAGFQASTLSSVSSVRVEESRRSSTITTSPSTTLSQSDYETWVKRKSETDKELAEISRRYYEKERQGSAPPVATDIFNFRVIASEPDSDGRFKITVNAGRSIRSFFIDGIDQGASPGTYQIERIARIGQTTSYDLVLVDSQGNTARQQLTVSRPEARIQAAQAPVLSPQLIKKSASRDAVAVIIGVADYRRVPRAEYADADARAFYDYARLGLGVQPENIRLLVNEKAESVEIFRTLRTWLPARVSSDKTDVYIFFSGHGLPSPDGKVLYILPSEVDRDYLERTAISQTELISIIAATKPRSAVLLLDSCYSGQTRSGQSLLADARPISVNAKLPDIPKNFSIFSASAPDQISYSSPDLKHGFFSFFVMKGLEGEADINKDGRITLGELRSYVGENVSRLASRENRKQTPMLVGNENQVLR